MAEVICTFAGVNVQLTPTGMAVSVYDPGLTGAPAQERLTNPVKPFAEVTVAITFPESPGASVCPLAGSAPGEIVSEKPGADEVAASGCSTTTSDCDLTRVASPL